MRLHTLLLGIAACALLAPLPARAQRVYWIDTFYRSPALRQVNLDGTGLRTLALPAGTLPEGLALDAATHQLYWGDARWSGARVHRALFDFTGPAAITDTLGPVHGLALDHAGGRLYWTTSRAGTRPAIVSSLLDGTGVTVLDTLPASANPKGIAVDPAHGKLYFADYDRGLIQTCNLDGSSLATLVTLPANRGPWGIAVDPTAGMLYWTDYAAGLIERATVNGVGQATLRSELGNPTYIAVNAPAGGLVWVEARAGAQRLVRGGAGAGSDTVFAAPDSAYGGIVVDWTNLADVPGENAPVTELALGLQSPSPVTADVALQLSLPAPARVELAVFDLQGRRVAVLRDGPEPEGRQTIVWNVSPDGRRVSPGVYFVRLRALRRDITRRLVVAR